MGSRIGEKPSVYNSDYVPTHNKAVLGAPAGLGPQTTAAPNLGVMWI